MNRRVRVPSGRPPRTALQSVVRAQAGGVHVNGHVRSSDQGGGIHGVRRETGSVAANRAAPDQQPPDGDLVTDTPGAPSDDLLDAPERQADDDPGALATTDGVRHDPLARLEAVGASMPSQRRSRRRLDVKLLLASLGIAFGIVLVVLGLMRSVTGNEEQGLPDAIESIDPVRNATQVPQQTRVFVDFVVGYEAVMIVDGVELPLVSLDDVGKTPPGLGEGGGDQIEIPPGAIWEPGNATLTFEPGPSQAIESFSTGMHTVTVRYWRTEDGPDRFRTFSWSFYAV